MKLILSTLALGAAATSSALDLNGDAPPAPPAPEPGLAPAIELPQDAPMALVPLAPAVAETPAAPEPAAAPQDVELPSSVPMLSSIPLVNDLFQDDDELEKSAKELEKELATLRKQLAKMRKEMREGDEGEAREEARRARALVRERSAEARERGREARERGREARERAAEVRVRGEEVRKRGQEARARGEEARRRAEERVVRLRAEAPKVEERVARLRVQAEADRKDDKGGIARLRVLEKKGDADAKEEVFVLRGGAGAIGIGSGAGGGVHNVQGYSRSHDHDGDHGSTINIHVDEGDVHIHAHGSSIHTSKGAKVETKKGGARFGFVTPHGQHDVHEIHEYVAKHLHGEGPHEMHFGVGEWTEAEPGQGAFTFEWTGEGDFEWKGDGKAPKIQRWVTKKKGSDDEDENVFFFSDGDGGDFEFEAENFFEHRKGKVFTGQGGTFEVEVDPNGGATRYFTLPGGGQGMVRVEVDGDNDEDHDVDVEVGETIRVLIDGEEIEIPGGAGGVVLHGGDGEHTIEHFIGGADGAIAIGGVGGLIELKDLEGLESLEGLHGLENIKIELEGLEALEGLKALENIQIEGIEIEEIEEVLEDAFEAIEEIEIEGEAAPKVERRIIRRRGKGDADAKDPKQNRFYLRGNTQKKDAEAPSDSGRTAAGFSPDRGSWPVAAPARVVAPNPFTTVAAGVPAPGDDELMLMVRDIHAEIRLMRAELAELRAAVFAAPVRGAGQWPTRNVDRTEYSVRSGGAPAPAPAPGQRRR